jgi:rubrerythrin
MGFNQLEKPVFKKFQLIPENENNSDLSGVPPETVKDTNEDLKPQIEGLQLEIEGIKAEIEKLKAERPKKKIAAKLAREENEDET